MSALKLIDKSQIAVSKCGKSYFNQSETARLAGVNQSSVSRYFNNLGYAYLDDSLDNSMFYPMHKNEKYILDIDVA